jgi:uncharacterized protein (TIGR03790 family)
MPPAHSASTPTSGDRHDRGRLLPLAFLALALASPGPWATEQPARSIGSATLAVVVNEADGDSVALGEYYVRRRQIPAANLVRIRFEPGRPIMPVAEFRALRKEVLRETPAGVQAYALAWVQPYRVGCMSVTTAFAAGFDKKYCGEKCALTARRPYYDSDVALPQDELSLRPTMALAALTLADGRALVDRGIAADGTAPPGTAYLVRTLAEELGSRLDVRYLETDALRDRDDVLFYFTGAAKVDGLDSNRFRPGAIGDHLTSGGGKLVGGKQMSALRWLEAGATASFGTVVEPCSIPEKFPEPAVVMRRYLAGETLIEAYWKSVQMPGQGIFIGEPLARPYGPGAGAKTSGGEHGGSGS